MQTQLLEDSVGEKEYMEARDKAKVAIARTIAGRDAFDDYGLPENVGEPMDDMLPPVEFADGGSPVMPPLTIDSEDWDNPFPMLDRPMSG